MTLYRVKTSCEDKFAKANEVFPGVHLGRLNDEDEHWCMVVGCRVIVILDQKLSDELQDFYNKTWRDPIVTEDGGANSIVTRYNTWLGELTESETVAPHPVDRGTFAHILATAYPPPPPNRTTLLPVVPPPAPPPPPSVYGHLPFKTKTQLREHFYRFEAWPTSRKLLQGLPATISSGTYASPSSELPFLPTGFAAVARNSLPSFFPAVFRYEFQPVATQDMLCGAIIPNFGRSGGGVEVFFPSAISNNGPLANPVIVPPF